MAQILFWTATLLILHTYFFYPLLLILADAAQQALTNLRFIARGEERRFRGDENFFPGVSLMVAAFNEERCLEDKIANSLSLSYPPSRFEVVIGSDGSTDRTNEIVRTCRDPRVRLSSGSGAGKVNVLNRCIPSGRGDIIVLSDANTLIEKGAIRKLVRHFEDPDVGVVCGRLKLYNPTKRSYEESTYWIYESLIKFYESKRGMVMDANGGLYAIRRTLYERLPDNAIVGHFLIPLRILDRGYKVLYEPEAVAYGEGTEENAAEFSRRAGIAAGNFQTLRLLPGLVSPFGGLRAFALWSHKILRWCAPALMTAALASNLLLLRGIFFQFTFALQAIFYGMAFVGRNGSVTGALKRIVLIPYYFVAMNLAIAVGFWRFSSRWFLRLRNARARTGEDRAVPREELSC